MFQRSHCGSFGASFDVSLKNCTISALTKIKLLLMQKKVSRSNRMMFQRSHCGSFGASFDVSLKNCTISALTKIKILLMQNYFEGSSNDAPKEPLRLLWSIIRWLLEELPWFCINKSFAFINAGQILIIYEPTLFIYIKMNLGPMGTKKKMQEVPLLYNKISNNN